MAYVKLTFPQYDIADHLTECAAHLEAVERGEIDRLIIVEPPRHGKSLYLVSQTVPCLVYGHATPQMKSFMQAMEARTRCRIRASSQKSHGWRELHASIFPEATLSIDSKAANLWHTTQDGVYVAAGVGGPITGRGAHLLLIDDPVKSREEAESATYRERTYDWYQNDAYTRLMPGGRIIVISTRWHEDDLVGRLLRDQEKGGDKWTFLHHPAINANGEALWPARYPVKALHRIRSNVGPRAWQSLYQGDPTPESGTYFSIESIKRDVMPNIRTMKLYGASDYAVTDDGGDWTVHLVVGMDSEERLWVVDMWRGKTTADRWIPPLIALMKKYSIRCSGARKAGRLRSRWGLS